MTRTNRNRFRISPTIRDVARAAGVVPSTVSKHYNGAPHVSKETAARIQQVIDELGYEPYGPGRSLVRGRTGLIGVIVASIWNPFYAELVSALNDEAGKQSLSLVLGATEDVPGQEKQIAKVLRQSGVDGMVLASAHMGDRDLLELIDHQTPIVLASRHVPDLNADFVAIDGEAGGQLAVDHLVGLGHQRIAYFGGSQTVLQFRERLRGYERALSAAGIELESNLVFHDMTGPSGTRQSLRSVMAEPRDLRPTAVFAATDYLALGVMAEARDIGVEVPRDLSIVGFDNIAFGELGVAPLTTVDSRIGDIGRLAIRFLVNRLEHGGKGVPFQKEKLIPYLHVRESTAKPRKKEL